MPLILHPSHPTPPESHSIPPSYSISSIDPFPSSYSWTSISLQHSIPSWTPISPFHSYFHIYPSYSPYTILPISSINTLSILSWTSLSLQHSYHLIISISPIQSYFNISHILTPSLSSSLLSTTSIHRTSIVLLYSYSITTVSIDLDLIHQSYPSSIP